MTPGEQPARDLGTPGGYQRPEAPVDRERAVSFREWVRQAEFVGTHELAHHAIVLESRDVDTPFLDCPPGRGAPGVPAAICPAARAPQDDRAPPRRARRRPAGYAPSCRPAGTAGHSGANLYFPASGRKAQQ